MSPWMWCLPFMEHSVEMTMPTGVNAAGDAGDTSPQYFGWGDVNGNIPPILLRTFGYSRPLLVAPVRSASSRFHSVIRRHQFASVRQADSRLTRLVPPTLNSRWRHWLCLIHTYGCRMSRSRICCSICSAAICRHRSGHGDRRIRVCPDCNQPRHTVGISRYTSAGTLTPSGLGTGTQRRRSWHSASHVSYILTTRASIIIMSSALYRAFWIVVCRTHYRASLCKLSYDQISAASLIGRNAVTWRWSLSNDQPVTVDRVSL